jgi:hypothetical protein
MVVTLQSHQLHSVVFYPLHNSRLLLRLLHHHEHDQARSDAQRTEVWNTALADVAHPNNQRRSRKQLVNYACARKQMHAARHAAQAHLNQGVTLFFSRADHRWPTSKSCGRSSCSAAYAASARAHFSLESPISDHAAFASAVRRVTCGESKVGLCSQSMRLRPQKISLPAHPQVEDRAYAMRARQRVANGAKGRT